MTLLMLAIAPGLAICLYIFHRDIYNREPKINLIVCFVLGMLAIIPAFIIEALIGNQLNNTAAAIILFSYFIVAGSEEVSKFVVLRFYAYPRKSFDEPLDGIVYSVMVGMGFATVENIGYVQQHGMGVAFVRMFLSVPAHGTFAVLMGYHVGRAKFDPVNSGKLMALGLFWAIFFHGTFDSLLFLGNSSDINSDTYNILLFAGALVSFIVAIRLSNKLIKKHRLISQQMFPLPQVLTIRNATVQDIPLIRDLTYKIWPQTYAAILSKDQIDYMMDLMYNEATLRDQMEGNHHFIIVYEGALPVGFASYSETKPSVFKLHKIYILPNQQGKGTGRFVIDQILKEIQPHGAKKLQLNVNRNNQAKDFYQKLGFTVIREEDIDIGKGYFMNDYIMEKVLS